MHIHTYPKMNQTIKNLLRINQDEPMKAYILARIEELEQQVAETDGKVHLYNELQQKYDAITNKLADIRDLFDSPDMASEGHGMEDMAGSPLAVAYYAESKIKRLMAENQRLQSELKERKK